MLSPHCTLLKMFNYYSFSHSMNIFLIHWIAFELTVPLYQRLTTWIIDGFSLGIEKLHKQFVNKSNGQESWEIFQLRSQASQYCKTSQKAIKWPVILWNFHAGQTSGGIQNSWVVVSRSSASVSSHLKPTMWYNKEFGLKIPILRIDKERPRFQAKTFRQSNLN